MKEYSREVSYDIGRIMVDAAKNATLEIIRRFEVENPDKRFDVEQFMCYLDESDDELIVFFHDLALKYKPEKHIAATRTITDKSLSTIERRVN